MAELKAIWIKRMKLGPMDPFSEAELRIGEGIVGNANQGGRRQVTLIDEAAWANATETLPVVIAPFQRRANLMISGLSLFESRGRILSIGSCRIRINGETRPCERMDEVFRGLKQALEPNWGGGAYGEVLVGGVIRVGDLVSFDLEAITTEFTLPQNLFS
ncbi:MAG: MOSC domain-containing protein [Blastocatellia bacterium]|nr:MOSC domain-containing protein [Blastocatellia bacterium]